MTSFSLLFSILYVFIFFIPWLCEEMLCFRYTIAVEWHLSLFFFFLFCTYLYIFIPWLCEEMLCFRFLSSDLLRSRLWTWFVLVQVKLAASFTTAAGVTSAMDLRYRQKNSCNNYICVIFQWQLGLYTFGFPSRWNTDSSVKEPRTGVSEQTLSWPQRQFNSPATVTDGDNLTVVFGRKNCLVI